MTPPPAAILIVDDEPQNRKLLETMLRPEGYLTRTAADGNEALASVSQDPPDLVLLDVMMPGMDGYQVARALKANPATSHIPIIMVTASIGRDSRLAGLDAGAEEFLNKPVDRGELWLRVRNMLRIKAYGDLLKNQGAILEQKVLARTAELERSSTLRIAEAGKQAAVLNALPAHVALLDADGCILSVNQAWRIFGTANALQGPGHAIGVNYLDVCDAARGDDAADARLAAAGIRSVLTGGAASFSFEYACHSATEQRWFLMTVTPLAEGRPDGAIVMHVNVTERMKVDEDLRRFRAAMEVSGDGIVLVDRASMRYVDVNQTLCDLVGYTREEVLGMTPTQLFDAAPAALERDYDALIRDNNHPASKVDGQYRRKDGSRVSIETRRRALHADSGWIIVGTARDISERKAAESKIIRLNRVYAVLSGINTLIVRVRDREELFKKACRIAVEDGGFQMAWIGLVDRQAAKLTLVAREGGDQDYADLLPLGLNPADSGQFGISAEAVLGKKPVLVQDLEHDARVILHQEAGKRDLHSLALLPLIVSDEAVGLLALYSNEIGFFDEGELKLLRELAGDIAFAIDHIGKRDQLDYLAYYDVLTGLANRRLFLERVAQYMRSATTGQHKLAVFLVDLERFKNINDSLGQTAGDALLNLVADWIKQHAGDASLVARIGADHFALVLPRVRDDEGVSRLVEKTLARFVEHSFRLDGAVLRIGAKVGVALYPGDGTDADSLLKNAEAALKKAKAGGDKFLFYTQTMTEKVAGKLTLENQLRQALDNDEFVLHYQPKVRLATGRITSAEALIRWNHPEDGLVAPGRFVPILEETGLIYEVGRWALRKAVADYLRWRRAGLEAVRIAVNVSPLQLRNRGFIDEIKSVVGVDAYAADGLELEITESLIMEDVRHSTASLQAIRAMGVTIAIDDFGTGFSSLSHLAKLPVDTLKIDRSFVVDMMTGPNGLSLVSTIINLAHALRLKVVAEGVETDEQSRLLRLLNCDEMQGFLFSKPLPAAEFERTFLPQRGSAQADLVTLPRGARPERAA